jgi:hypothetical protein
MEADPRHRRLFQVTQHNGTSAEIQTRLFS